jgi:hypothetical protein
MAAKWLRSMQAKPKQSSTIGTLLDGCRMPIWKKSVTGVNLDRVHSRFTPQRLGTSG